MNYIVSAENRNHYKMKWNTECEGGTYTCPLDVAIIGYIQNGPWILLLFFDLFDLLDLSRKRNSYINHSVQFDFAAAVVEAFLVTPKWKWWFYLYSSRFSLINPPKRMRNKNVFRFSVKLLDHFYTILIQIYPHNFE